MWDFPSPATSGQVFTPVAGVDYVYNGVAWELPSAGALELISLLPAFLECGGPNLRMRVKGLGFTAASVVRFDGAAQATTYGDSTELQVLVMASLEAVPRTVQVTVANGVVVSNTLPLNFAVLPTLTSVVPDTLSMTAGADLTVTCTGTNFTTNTKAVIEGFELPTTFVSATQLTAVVQPAMGSAVGQVYFWVQTGQLLPSNILWFNWTA